MNPNVNRLGDNSKPSPELADRTQMFVAQLMLGKPKISRPEIVADGTIKFRLPLARTALTNEWMERARLLRTRFVINFMGEFLIRANIYLFDDIISLSDYPELVRAKRHGGFGLSVRPDYLEFACHCELLNRIFNEGLRQELRGIAT